MKKIVTLLVTLALFATTFAACAASAPASSVASSSVASSSAAATKNGNIPDFRIAAVVMDMTNEYFTNTIAGYQAFADLSNGHVKLEKYDGQNKPEKQVEIIETLISSGVNAIMLNSIDESATHDTVLKALKAGILVCQYPDVDKMPLTEALTFDEYQWGRLVGTAAGNWIKEKLNGKATVATISQMQLPTCVLRTKGEKDAIIEICGAENINFLETVDTVDPNAAHTALESILQAHPETRVLMGITDDPVVGGYEAIIASGQNDNKWFVAGCDGTSRAMELIQKGTIYRGSAVNTYKTQENAFWMAENLAKKFYAVGDCPRNFVVDNVFLDNAHISAYVNAKPAYKLSDDMAKFFGGTK
ncbi:MAG: sugar ABC transporter substrate-binding protein [Ruminiclostridium sp.]